MEFVGREVAHLRIPGWQQQINLALECSTAWLRLTLFAGVLR